MKNTKELRQSPQELRMAHESQVDSVGEGELWIKSETGEVFDVLHGRAELFQVFLLRFETIPHWRVLMENDGSGVQMHRMAKVKRGHFFQAASQNHEKIRRDTNLAVNQLTDVRVVNGVKYGSHQDVQWPVVFNPVWQEVHEAQPVIFQVGVDRYGVGDQKGG